MADKESVQVIADGFAQAALQPKNWMLAIESLAKATGSSRGELVGYGPKGRLFNWVSAVDTAVTDHFLRFDHSNPRVNFRIGAAQHAQPLQIVYEAHYDAVIPTLISQDYVEFCRRWDMMHGCQSTILATKDSLVGLSVLRTEKEGRTNEDQRALFSHVVPHVLAAVRMQSAIENQGFQLLTGTMHAMGAAAFTLDAQGMVRGLSPSAEALVSKGDRLRLVRGRLRASLLADDVRLQSVIARAMPTTRGADGLHAVTAALTEADSIAVLQCANGDFDPLVLDILPLPEAPWSMGYQPRVVVVARGAKGPLKSGADSSSMLSSAYGLTEAEAAIACQLARGVSREVIASQRGVSVMTVRTQIRTIFRKLDVSREGELVAKVSALVN